MAPPPNGLSELLQPTVVSATEARPPFRATSLLWPAFFGGVLPCSVLSLFQARRYRASGLETVQLILIMVMAAGGVMIAAAKLQAAESALFGVLHRGIALLAYLGTRATLAKYDRVYDLHTPEKRSSLWGWGLAATLLLGGLEGYVLFVVGGSEA